MRVNECPRKSVLPGHHLTECHLLFSLIKHAAFNLIYEVPDAVILAFRNISTAARTSVMTGGTASTLCCFVSAEQQGCRSRQSQQ